MNAEIFLAQRGINTEDLIEGGYGSEYILKDLMEAYAKQKVLEALELVKDEVWRSEIRGVQKICDIIETEVEPKYK